MNTFKINHAKNFLPLNIAKGTVEQRMQKARLMNLRFFDNLQDVILKREIKPTAFSRTLKETTKAPIKIEIINPNTVPIISPNNVSNTEIPICLKISLFSR